MKKKSCIRILSLVVCLLLVLCSCGEKKKVGDGDSLSAEAQMNEPKWIKKISADVQSIEPFVRAKYNKSTKHYEISYADCFKIKINNKYGIIDYNGEIVVPAEYESIVAIHERDDFLAVSKDKFDGTDRVYINYEDFSVEESYKTYNSVRYEYVCDTEDGNLAYLKHDGDSTSIQEANPYLPEAVRGGKMQNGEYVFDGTYGLFANEKNVMGMIYSGAGFFSNGAAAFKSNNTWGYIDANGKTVIPFGFDAVKGYSAFGGEDTPYECYDGYVAVTKDGKFGFMTNEGEVVTGLVYNSATPVVGGRAYVLTGTQWGLISFGDSADASARTTEPTTEKATVKQTTTSKPKDETTAPTREETTSEPETTDSELGTYSVNTDGLKLREEGTTASDVLFILDYGTTLEIDSVSDGWGHTHYNGYEGWVSLDYLEKE